MADQLGGQVAAGAMTGHADEGEPVRVPQKTALKDISYGSVSNSHRIRVQRRD